MPIAARGPQYTVRLTVTDDDDGATASSTTVISVAGAPVAPTNLQLVRAWSPRINATL